MNFFNALQDNQIAGTLQQKKPFDYQKAFSL